MVFHEVAHFDLIYAHLLRAGRASRTGPGGAYRSGMRWPPNHSGGIA